MSDQSSNRPLTGKAVTYKSRGGYEVIEYVERTVRGPAVGEVRIEVKAAAVNPTDILLRDPGFGNCRIRAHDSRRCTARARGRQPSGAAGNSILDAMFALH